MGKDIFKLKLHETMSVGCLDVMRVSGGFLYLTYDGQSGEVTSSTFVPFNNEFQKI